MKSKFLAGLIATLVALVVVIFLAIFLALVIEVNPSKNWFTTTAAFITIAVWVGMYRLLKPKDSKKSSSDLLDGELVGEDINVISQEEFINIYKKHPRKALLGGIIILVFFIPFGIGILSIYDLQENKMEYVFGIVFLIVGLLGVFVIVKSIIQRNKIISGEDNLLLAIKNKDQEFCKWFYGLSIAIGGMSMGSPGSYQVIIHTSENKRGVNIMVKNEEQMNDFVDFLKYHFPNAESEYSSEIKKKMKADYGFSGRK